MWKFLMNPMNVLRWLMAMAILPSIQRDKIRRETVLNKFRLDHDFLVSTSLRRRSSNYLNEATKKQRFRAIRICYFGIFVSSIVFSITISSLWPFLQIVCLHFFSICNWIRQWISLGRQKCRGHFSRLACRWFFTWSINHLTYYWLYC